MQAAVAYALDFTSIATGMYANVDDDRVLPITLAACHMKIPTRPYTGTGL